MVMLDVRDLRVNYPAGSVVRGVSFGIGPGEGVGLLGESGCGKSTTARALLGLLSGGAAASGSVNFRGREMLDLSEKELQPIRGAEISMIFQEPRAALNPVLRVGTQVAEVIRAHGCHADWRGVMARVGLDARIWEAYPHQLSGGQLQRVLIAQALACGPMLLLADEPTASLDSVTRAGILELLIQLRNAGIAMLTITHAPAVLTGLAGRVLIMYAGQIVEAGPRERVYARPLHPYTQALLACLPPPPGTGRSKRLPAIPGEPPDFADLPRGCAFAPRCARRIDACETSAPALIEVQPACWVRCPLYAG